MSFLPPGVDPSTIPTGEPPTGVIPNLTHPPTLIAPLLAVSIVLMIIASAFVVVRVYIRLKDNNFGLDDCLYPLPPRSLFHADSNRVHRYCNYHLLYLYRHYLSQKVFVFTFSLDSH